MVGRVCPRHGHRGRPLNSVVRQHQGIVANGSVEILRASAGYRPTIAAFLLAYLEEFGFREEYPYFEQYWLEAERHPFVISYNGEPVGFAFVRTLERAHEIAEFYVRPARRGCGIGRAAVEALFSAFSGPWRIPVQDSNTEGLKFWERVLPASGPKSIEGSSVVYLHSTAKERRDAV